MSKAVLRSIKNVTNGYTAAQVKVRKATSNDTWGPNPADLDDICELTYQNFELFEVMDMIDRRLNDKGKNWRHVMKALTVLDYLILNGSENVVLWCKDNFYVIKTLREFQYIDEDGRDQGTNIRNKAKELTALLQDDERLRRVRTEAQARGPRGGGGSGGGPSSSRRRRSTVSGAGRNPRHNNDDGFRPPAGAPPRGGRSVSAGPDDEDEVRRAIEASRLTAEQDEERRKQRTGTDEDLRKALLLSEEEAQLRNRQSIFSTQQAPLIDTSDPFQQLPQMQQQNLFGHIYGQNQQPLATGLLQNAYATGQPQYGYGQPVQNQYTGYQPQPVQNQYTGYQPQPVQNQYQPPQQQQQPQPLQPLKTGSNNPFAQFNQTPQPQPNAEPSLNQIQQTQPQRTGGASRPGLQRTNTFDANHMNNLNDLLANGDGIDTFGNVGDLRIPAQHTKSTFVNSAGQTTGHQGQPQNNNPFVTAHYTGVASANPIQPAFTGYGFGNAPQNNQQQQQQQQQQYGQARPSNNLIDF